MHFKSIQGPSDLPPTDQGKGAPGILSQLARTTSDYRSDTVVQTDGKFWAIWKAPDALKSDSRKLVSERRFGLAFRTEWGIVYNRASKKTNG